MKRDSAGTSSSPPSSPKKQKNEEEEEQTLDKEGNASANKEEVEEKPKSTEKAIQLLVLFFATAREATGVKELSDFSLPAGSDTDDFIKAVIKRFPRLEKGASDYVDPTI
jgi:hypothetical protein